MQTEGALTADFTYRGTTVRFDAARRILQVGGEGSPPPQEIARPLKLLSPEAYRDSASAATTLYILNAGACNVACTYCDVHMGRFLSPARMTQETCRSVVRFIRKNLAVEGARFNVVFFGGEPLLNFEAVKYLVKACGDLREEGLDFFFQIPTNVTLVTPEIARFCLEQNLYVELSFDGPRDVQDAYRRYPDGRSTYDDVQKGIERLLELFPPEKLVARPTLSKVSRTREVFDYFLERGFRVIQFGMVKKGRPEAFDPDDFYACLDYVMERWIEETAAGRSLIVTPLAHYFRELWLFLARGMAVRSVDCGAGVFQLAFAPGGEIYPCAEFAALDGAERFRLGSCSEGIDEGRRAAFLREFSTLRSECENCWGKVLCQGGCKLYNTYESGRRYACTDQGLEVERLWKAALYWYGRLRDTDPAVLVRLIDTDFVRDVRALLNRKGN
jgi:uncharacterized protein